MSVEKINIDSKQELEQMIAKDIGQIETNLTVICTQVPINDKTTIDALCHDENGQLVVLQVNVSEDDNALLQGIQSLDYVDKFKSFLKMTYGKHKIDDKEKPRLILVAPNFSETLRHTVQHIHDLHIELYEWEYLKIGDHKGLRLQSIFTWKQSDWKAAREPVEKEQKPTEKKTEPKPSKKREPASHLPENKEEEAQPKPQDPAPEQAKENELTEQMPSLGEAPNSEEPSRNETKEEPPKRKRFF